MIREVDDYIDQMGGDWTLDYQYLRKVVEIFYLDIHASRVYDAVAEFFHTTYAAVQKGVGRISYGLWEAGREMLRRDLERPKLEYPGPLGLARWIARAITKNRNDW